jgi:hypothetical protein
MGSMVQYVLPVALFVAAVATQAVAPAEFTGKQVGSGGGGSFKDSPHFRVYGANNDGDADKALKMLEAAYACYVGDLGWRSHGLSYKPGENGPWLKENIYAMTTVEGGAAGVMKTDPKLGMSYLHVGKSYLAQPKVTVHEYGHALTYHERNWVEQKATGAWWEGVANW